jgi:hypothetical protein
MCLGKLLADVSTSLSLGKLGLSAGPSHHAILYGMQELVPLLDFCPGPWGAGGPTACLLSGEWRSTYTPLVVTGLV